MASSACVVEDKSIASFVTWKIQSDFQVPESQNHFYISLKYCCSVLKIFICTSVFH